MKPSVYSLTTALWIASLTPAAFALECGPLSEWLKTSEFGVSPTSTTMTERAAELDREWKARTQATSGVYRSYLSKNWDLKNLSPCLANRADRQNFLNSLQNVFFKSTLKTISGIQTPIFLRFSQILRTHFGSGNFPMLRMTGHGIADSPADLPAGVHRASGSIFVNLDLIPSENWLMIFSHELIHTLDDSVFPAIEIYSDSERVKKFVALSDSGVNLNGLSSDERESLFEWIRAGLDRGLWAEYRAWTVTLALYLEGVQSGKIQKLEWMDDIFKERKPAESIAALVYRRLDEKAQDPSDYPFNRPLFLEALHFVRENAKVHLPTIGSTFGALINGTHR